MTAINRQKLDSDMNQGVHNHTNVFREHSIPPINSSQKGFFLKTWVVISLFIVAILCIVLVALFVGVFNPFCDCDNSANLPKCVTNASMHQIITQCSSKITDNSPLDTTKVSPLNASVNHTYVRLPTSIVPIHYDVQLQTYIGPQDFYFNGNVSIKCHRKCQKSF